ncbi:MAG: 1-acyl-sn-glycerol-3-phosphate acyltransferase [Myxococcales bacterium]|nr:1-acyl-sn-glycerol-3-phosphate acyltransferase [Myxococcales bacterium]
MNRREPFLHIWGRRLISFSAYAALATTMFALAPLLLLAAALYGAARGGDWSKVRVTLFFLLYLGCEAWGLLAAGALWLLTLGGVLISAGRYQDLNAGLQRAWSNALFWGSVRIFAMKVEVQGQELAASGPMLLLVRHCSSADTVLAAALVANPNKILLRYVLKKEMLWDPCLDVVGRRLPNAFIDRASRKRGEEVALITGLAKGLDRSTAVLIYPEGTRFSPAKRARALEKLRPQPRLFDLATEMQAVLPPKLAGPLALLDASPGTDVVVLEHQGFERAASFKEVWRGGLVGARLRVRVRRIKSDEIPSKDKDLWLFEQWTETDRWVREQTATEPRASDNSAGSTP